MAICTQYEYSCLIVCLQLPRVCWFQEIEYTVELKRMDVNGVLVAKTELQTVKYWKKQSVTIRFEDDLSSGATYTATAFFKSITDVSGMNITTTLRKCYCVLLV